MDRRSSQAASSLKSLLITGAIILLTAETASGAAISQGVCDSCCDLAFDGLAGFEEPACQAGCLNVVTETQIDASDLLAISDPFFRAACDAHKDECKVGLDWIADGFTSRSLTSNGNVLDGTPKFCVSPGNFSSTNAPSASPTTPAPVTPTRSPTSEPTPAPARKIDDGIDYVAPLAGGIGSLAGLSIVLYALYRYTKRQYIEDQKGFERKEGKGWISSEAKPVVAPPRPKILGPPPGLGPPGLGPSSVPPGSSTYSTGTGSYSGQTNALQTVPPAQVVFVYEDEEGEHAQGGSERQAQQPPAQQEQNLQKPFRAIADFEPEHSDELAVREGDQVMGIRPIDENWWLAEADGRKGIVPLNFLEEVDL